MYFLSLLFNSYSTVPNLALPVFATKYSAFQRYGSVRYDTQKRFVRKRADARTVQFKFSFEIIFYFKKTLTTKSNQIKHLLLLNKKLFISTRWIKKYNNILIHLHRHLPLLFIYPLYTQNFMMIKSSWYRREYSLGSSKLNENFEFY
jgi:hypothetical protein